MFSGVRIQLIITHKYHKVGIKLLRFRIISKKVKKNGLPKFRRGAEAVSARRGLVLENCIPVKLQLLSFTTHA